jgi:phosphoribosylformylglycinamidine synthase
VRIGVVVFPGSNCDHDLMEAVELHTGSKAETLWHKEKDLKGCDMVFLPGGFSYGDYLRSGAIAAQAPVMDAVRQHAAAGGLVMGICNGFQILCEAGLLPGALLRNTSMQFICSNVLLKPENTDLAVTRAYSRDETYTIPIAHGEGRFYADASTLQQIEENGQVMFRYSNAAGQTTEASNPNGSLNHIAGICNAGRNVFGMMPHPERAAFLHSGNMDGALLFKSLVGAVVV